MSAIESCLLVEVESIRILAFHVAWMKSELRRLERSFAQALRNDHETREISQRARGIGITVECSGGATATPSRNATSWPELAATRSPGTMMPTRFNGSAAEIVMTSPLGC